MEILKQSLYGIGGALIGSAIGTLILYICFRRKDF